MHEHDYILNRSEDRGDRIVHVYRCTCGAEMDGGYTLKPDRQAPDKGPFDDDDEE